MNTPKKTAAAARDIHGPCTDNARASREPLTIRTRVRAGFRRGMFIEIDGVMAGD